MGLSADLGPGPTALDTAVFIYHLEENSLTLLEVLGVPYRTGNLGLADRYEGYLSRSRGVRLLEIGREQLRIAAQLRALHPGRRTPCSSLQPSPARAPPSSPTTGTCRS